MLDLKITKMHGAGNDFIVLDDYSCTLSIPLESLAKGLCSRGFGLGTDGLLVLRKSESVDFEMIYLNSDGSYGGMCGNGGRCIARYANLKGISSRNVKFLAHGQIYTAEVFDSNKVRLYLPDPDKIIPDLPVPVGTNLVNTVYVYPNTDHTVLFQGEGFEDIESIDIIPFARVIRYNFEVFSQGTNVNLVKKIGENKIRMRTYERGVENETLACGTGSVASAIGASLKYGMKSPIDVKTTGGEILRVYFNRNGSSFSNISLEGSAVVLFETSVIYDQKLNMIVDRFDGHKTV
ncbi:MAG: diaminopimelate epimerase [Candidatus Kryptoniota bacterium]